MVHLFIYSTSKPENILGNGDLTVSRNKKLHLSEGFYSTGEREGEQAKYK